MIFFFFSIEWKAELIYDLETYSCLLYVSS